MLPARYRSMAEEDDQSSLGTLATHLHRVVGDAGAARELGEIGPVEAAGENCICLLRVERPGCYRPFEQTVDVSVELLRRAARP
jgi:hypothetical protein